MKEIFFGLGFSTKELDVIEEEHIDTPVAVSEFFGLFLFESSHKLVGILFCPDVENFQFVFKGFMSDGVKQVGFTKS